MKTIAVVMNIPSPYRSDLFNYIQSEFKNYNVYIIYQSENEDNRKWKIETKLKNEIFLESKTFKIKKKLDYKYIHISRNLETKLKSISPDLVVVAEYNIDSFRTVRWCIKNNIRYTSWTDGTTNSETNINVIHKILRKYIISNANSYIASSSRSMENQVSYGANAEKITISPLTVNTKKYLYKKENKIINEKIKLLFVGRLVEIKGIDILIDIMSKLNRDNYELNIVGDGYLLTDLEKKIDNYGLKNNIFFRGYLEGEELLQYYRMSNLFILPSLSESFGLVILEAMCNSLGIICSEYVDSHPDLIKKGKNGIIFNPLDEVDCLIKLRYILDNEAILEKMGDESFQIAESFSIQNSAELFKKGIDMGLY